MLSSVSFGVKDLLTFRKQVADGDSSHIEEPVIDIGASSDVVLYGFDGEENKSVGKKEGQGLFHFFKEHRR